MSETDRQLGEHESAIKSNRKTLDRHEDMFCEIKGEFKSIHSKVDKGFAGMQNRIWTIALLIIGAVVATRPEQATDLIAKIVKIIPFT